MSLMPAPPPPCSIVMLDPTHSPGSIFMNDFYLDYSMLYLYTETVKHFCVKFSQLIVVIQVV